MKITTVRYRKLVTGREYSNQAVEAEATIEDGESADDALLNLSLWVRSQLGESSAVGMDLEALRNEVNFLHSQAQQLRGAVATKEAELRKLRDEILALEVKREDLGGEPAIPF